MAEYAIRPIIVSCACTNTGPQVLLWRVPENFTLRPDVDPEEVQDVAPVGKLNGHPK